VLARAGLHRDIEYGTIDGVRLLLDIHVPEGEGPFPVLIMVHGGGWASGDKAQDVSPILEPVTGRLTWFSINYRLAPKYRWPACLEDVQASIRWVKDNAPRYKGDPHRIAIAGYSVGGHLGPLAANLAPLGTGVNAVIGVAPNTDLVKDSERRGGLRTLHYQGRHAHDGCMGITRPWL
jgi:acetyl esterase/lipase